jgi:hypothetical protein
MTPPRLTFKPCISSAIRKGSNKAPQLSSPVATSDVTSNVATPFIRDREVLVSHHVGKSKSVKAGAQRRRAKGPSSSKPRINWKTFKERQNNHEFDRGNYHGYYLYRNHGLKEFEDYRVKLLLQIPERCLERMKTCSKWVDVGSNAGDLTILLSLMFNPHRMYGIELDTELVKQAQAKVRSLVALRDGQTYCITEEGVTFVPTGSAEENNSSSVEVVPSDLCDRLVFVNKEFQDFYKASPDEMNSFEVISCFSVIKWIHLYGGDIGLMHFFESCKSLLTTGGLLLFEYQEWESYLKKQNLNDVSFLFFKDLFKSVHL